MIYNNLFIKTIKKINVIIVFLFCIVFSFTNVYATSTFSNIPSSVNIDISNGILQNSTLGFKIDIKKAINNDDLFEHVVAEEVILKDKKAMQKKINFYYLPYEEKYNRELIVSLYIFSRAQWKDSYSLDKIEVTKNYVYAAQKYNQPPYGNSEEGSRLLVAKKALGTARALKKVLLISNSELIEYYLTVFIDGEATSSKVKKIDKTFYIPLRSIGEKLGYEITWDKSRVITVRKDDFEDIIKIANGPNLAKGGKIVTVNGVTYVSTPYFMMALGQSIEIDSNENIFIVKN